MKTILALMAPLVILAQTPEAMSLLGRPLVSAPPTGGSKALLEGNLAKAQADFDANPRDPEAIIWLGRRLAYLGRFRDAINVYSQGIALYPGNAKLYRHRGHRYITIRKFDEAIADFEKAAGLVRGKPDEIEPDGIPNKRNQPRSTLQFNIHYHLGLARYLKADFRGALKAYLDCLEVSRNNDDSLAATSDWLYMTYRRLGDKASAEKVLERIREGMDIVENDSYLKRLLMYKGLRAPETLLAAEGADDLSLATQGYGVGNWYLYNGDRERAKRIFEQVVAGKQWSAFGYIAAEAELARMQ